MSHFDESYAGKLYQRYPSDVVDQVVAVPQLTDTNGYPYVHIHPKGGDLAERPVMLIPGFGEGIINQSAPASELAGRGFEVILPGQDRKQILRDAENKRSAVHTQAIQYLEVLDDALTDVRPDSDRQPVDIVTHSYGSLIFQAMTRIRPERFQGSNAVLLAPAGSVVSDNAAKLGVRWTQFLRSEMDTYRPMEMTDPTGATGKASMQTLLANVPRMLREVGDLARRRIDYPSLARSVGSLTVVSYAEDKLFPSDKLYPMMEQAMQPSGAEPADISWVMPVSPSRVVTGEMGYGGHGATHDDEQFNPSRVGAVVEATLRA